MEYKMPDQEIQNEQEKKHLSGFWVLLLFIVLLFGVVVLELLFF
jgi:hypothetical protein